MNRRRIPLAFAAAAALTLSCAAPPAGLEVAVSFAAAVEPEPVDGRLLLLLAPDDAGEAGPREAGPREAGPREPRFQVRAGLQAIQVFGVTVDGLGPGEQVAFADGEPSRELFGYPHPDLGSLPPGEYQVQAVLHRYETFHRADGHTVKLPMDRGEGQQWNRAPGNLISTPQKLRIAPGERRRIAIELDQVIPAIEEPADTEYVKHVKIESRLLSEFWGRPMHLGAHVLLPEGFAEHPEARYPLVIFHGHFPADFGGFRPEPPDPDLECEYSERFRVDCYNRIQQQEAHDFYRAWTGPGFPRLLIVEIQHPNPYYDDSYAVNSANLGPYGDAITHELVPEIEKRFRGLGAGWARFLYGGSTGGWEALGAQVFYPDDYNGCFAACPDPIDFRAYVSVDVYADDNAYFAAGPFRRLERPARRDWLGRISATMRDDNHLELALGSRGRSGGQFDIWEAVYSPVGDDGYPRRLWDKRTGTIDPEVAAYWRENYDLRHILERDWATLGPRLAGKIHIYCGDMDNYYLNNAVYLMEEFLESTTDPYYGGEVDYGDRAEHCWNGDHENGNHISRLRYNTMYVPKILERIKASAPAGADLTSWRY